MPIWANRRHSAIKEAILKIFEAECPPTPEHVAKKLVWSDALTIDAIRFLVEEGELEKLPNRRVRIPETANQ
ncbi:MAG TPA: hypothetical protein VKK79_10135 [Candidatus Lokiarchaeia archaeon]|nr:hypothetical protein [Candidatus Lokiarchaeia archaeon]